ncbi:MAG: cytidine deaminase [Paludibacteraceae bacterium]|nr:cytidine deaminase [Paludibacteraceae bacterium]
MIHNYPNVPEKHKELVELAKSMTNQSYAPYSKFNVGAAVLLSDGTIVTGSNQENAAYGECVCAERVALLYAAANHPDKKPVALAVAACSDGKFTENCVTPCGSCRQVLLEMEKRFDDKITIVMYGSTQVLTADSAKDLLPLEFTDTQIKSV